MKKMDIGRIKYFFKIFRQAYGRYKRQIVVLTVLGFVGGLLEGIGVNALIPLLSFFMTGESGGDDFVSRGLQKVFGFFHINFNLVPLLILVSALFILKALATLWFNYIKLQIRAGYEREKRSNLFRLTAFSNWSGLLKQKVGFLETVLVTDVRGGAELLTTLSSSIMAITNLLVYLLVAINISAGFTALTLTVGGVMFLFIKPIIRRSREISQKTTRLNKDIAHFINEHVLGMRTVKTLVREDAVVRQADSFFERLRMYQIRTLMLGIIPTVFVQPLSVVYITAIIAAIYFYDAGITLAALAALIYLIHRIFYYLQSLQSKLTEVNVSLPYLEEVLRCERQAGEQRETDRGLQEFRFGHQLEFRGVSFFYDAGPVLEGVSFSVRRGEMVGLIGLSGAGKTTLFDLILRMFAPKEGSIAVDGVDLRSIKLSSLRKNIGYVSQDIFLLNDTVANNIKFYDEGITQNQVVEAAKAAHIHEFIGSLPAGYDTLVGERGIRLSVGQRQRVAIARTLARKPKLLLLDEATSALDQESEDKIRETLQGLKGSTTVLIIAHRLSTVVNADRLLALEHGKIKEEGPPAELLKDKQSYFYRVYNLRK